MAKSAKPATKSEILVNIAKATELSRKQVASVFEALSGQIKAAVGKKGPGVFAVPGLLKIMVIVKPATPQQGHQPLHQAGAGLQGQARPEGHQGPRPQGPQGHGEVRIRGSVGFHRKTTETQDQCCS